LAAAARLSSPAITRRFVTSFAFMSRFVRIKNLQMKIENGAVEKMEKFKMIDDGGNRIFNHGVRIIG